MSIPPAASMLQTPQLRLRGFAQAECTPCAPIGEKLQGQIELLGNAALVYEARR